MYVSNYFGNYVDII